MRIVNENPFFLKKLHQHGLYPNLKRTIFTFGDTIYNPGGFKIHYFLLDHEKVHQKQQEDFVGGAEAWWDKYLEDKKFRLSQEIPAYKAQYKSICKNVKDKNKRNEILIDIARSLSSSTYGNIITISEAIKELKYGM